MWQLELPDLGVVTAELDLYRWSRDGQGAFDGTLVVRAQAPEDLPGKLVAYIHGHFAVDESHAIVPIGARHVMQLVEHGLAEGWTPGSEQKDWALADIGWLPNKSPIANTHAPHYEGSARNTLTRDLQLPWDDWMQDWPLEVSDPSRIREFCDYYDRASDVDVRFDAMALALYSLDELGLGSREGQTHWPWFEARIRERFAFHAHQVAYFALLDAVELEQDRCFPLSPAMRKLWWDCLVPVPSFRILEPRD